jgi:hypothetical protein
VDGVRTGNLRIGSIGRTAGTVLGGSTTAQESAAGAITVDALDLTDGVVQTLVLESAATGTAISQTAPILVNHLATAVLGSGSVVLTQANGTAGIAHIARVSDTTLGEQTGSYQYTDASSVIVVSGTDGLAPPLIGQRDSGSIAGAPANTAIQTAAGNVTLNSGPGFSIEFINALSAPGATVQLTSTATIFNDAGGELSLPGGTLNMQAGTIDLGAAAVTAGTVNFTADFNVDIANADNAIDTVGATASESSFGFAIDINSTRSLVVASGGVRSLNSGSVTITTSGVLTINGDVSASDGSVFLTAHGVSAGTGILQTDGTISGPRIFMTTDGAVASIVQTGGSIATTGELIVEASGAVQLTSATNDVNQLFGSAGTDFRFVNSTTLTLGGNIFDPLEGISIGAGGYLDIAADSINIFSQGITPDFAAIGAVAGGGDNPTGVTVLRPLTAGTALTIGGPGTTGLSEAALVGGIRTGTLRIGSVGRAADTVLGGATTAQESAAGVITIAGLNLTGGSAVQTLVLETAAGGTAIGQTAPVLVNHLVTAVLGGGAVELTDPSNSTAGIAHIARLSDTALGTQSGTYRYVDGSSVIVVSGTDGTAPRLVGLRDSGGTAGLPPNAAIVTTGDVTLASGGEFSIEFINALVSTATVRLNSGADIFQQATGGVVATNLLAIANDGTVDLTAAPLLNNVQNIAGTANGDFRLINSTTVNVPLSGVGGDSLVSSTFGIRVGTASTLELGIATGNIVVDAPLLAPNGLVLLRRIAGATGSEIILNNTSFEIDDVAPPNLVVLDLTGSPTLTPGNFSALMTGTTPASGTSPIALGPNNDGGIILNGVGAENTTMYLVGGQGSTITGGGIFGLLGVYVAHSNPIALGSAVRQIDPTVERTVGTPFTEPLDFEGTASFYVRRRGEVVQVQTFNDCPIASSVCTPEIHIPPTVDIPPTLTVAAVGSPDYLVIDFVTDRVSPTPLNLTNVILVNQGNEYFFNADDEQRKKRAARGGQ